MGDVAADTAAYPAEGDGPLRELQREVEGDHPATGAANNRSSRDGEVVEQAGKILAIGKGHRLGSGTTEAATVVANDGVLLGQDGNLRIPHPQVADAGVDEHDGRAAPALFVEEFAARHGGVACREP